MSNCLQKVLENLCNSNRSSFIKFKYSRRHVSVHRLSRFCPDWMTFCMKNKAEICLIYLHFPLISPFFLNFPIFRIFLHYIFLRSSFAGPPLRVCKNYIITLMIYFCFFYSYCYDFDTNEFLQSPTRWKNSYQST